MQTEQQNTQQQGTEQKEVYTFNREEERWYISLDPSLSQGWNKQDLELVEGSQKILNVLSNGKKKLRLRISADPFQNATMLELVEHCAAPRGGGIYLLHAEKNYYSCLYWICDLALFVFGDIPDRIYLKRLPHKENENSIDSATDSLHNSQVATGTDINNR